MIASGFDRRAKLPSMFSKHAPLERTKIYYVY
jgi:hypothetical protein